jgi:hypothetical protein
MADPYTTGTVFYYVSQLLPVWILITLLCVLMATSLHQMQLFLRFGTYNAIIYISLSTHYDHLPSKTLNKKYLALHWGKGTA